MKNKGPLQASRIFWHARGIAELNNDTIASALRASRLESSKAVGRLGINIIPVLTRSDRLAFRSVCIDGRAVSTSTAFISQNMTSAGGFVYEMSSVGTAEDPTSVLSIA
jgi:hypothetical protein